MVTKIAVLYLEVTGNPGMVSASGSAGASTELRRGAATGRAFCRLSSSSPHSQPTTQNKKIQHQFIPKYCKQTSSSNNINGVMKVYIHPSDSLSSSSSSCFCNSASLALSVSIPTERSNRSRPWSNVSDEKTRDSRSKGIISLTGAAAGMMNHVLKTLFWMKSCVPNPWPAKSGPSPAKSGPDFLQNLWKETVFRWNHEIMNFHTPFD